MHSVKIGPPGIVLFNSSNPTSNGLNIDWLIKDEIESFETMPQNDKPTFTLSGNTITETKTGYTGSVLKNGKQSEITLTNGPADEKLKLNVAKRMLKWYVFTQLKK